MLSSVGLMTVQSSHAQELLRDHSNEQTSVLQVNEDIFEMLAVSNERDAQYVWILTKDGTFMEAGRDVNFRTRFTEPGTYMLDGSINSPEGQLLYRHSFTIEVPENRIAPEFTGQLLDATPPLQGSRISISEDLPAISLTPDHSRVRSMKIDTDVTQDRDGDGNPTNDPDTSMTLAAFDGSPLYLWIASEGQRSMQAELMLNDGQTNVQPITLVENTESNESVSLGGASMRFQEGRNGEVRFFIADERITASTPVVLYWDFGDGSMSTLMRPIHKYRSNGEYTVTVKAFDLRNGQTALTDEGRIVVNSASSTGSGAAGTVSSSSSVDTTPTVEPDTGTSRSIPWKPILLMILLAIGAAAVGLFLVWLIRKLLGGSGRLQQTLEEVEARIVERKEKDGVIDVAPPLQIKRTPKAPEEVKEESAPKESPLPPEPTPEETTPTPEPEPEPPAPVVNEEEAPEWLKKGLHTETTASEPTPNIPPAPEPTPEPEPAPAEEPQAPTYEASAEPPPSPAPEYMPPVETPQESPVPPAPEEVPQSNTEDTATDTDDEEEEEKSETLAPPTPAATATPQASLSPEEQARLERERQRKREKRMRYRQNKKKREMESKESNVAPSKAPTPSVPPSPESPKAVPNPPKVPVMNEAVTEAPSTPVSEPAPAEPVAAPEAQTDTQPSAPAEPLIPASVLEAPVATEPTPETPSAPLDAAPAAPVAVEPPAPTPALPTNLEGLLPEPETQTTNDNDVAFVIQADSLKQNNGTGDTSSADDEQK
jgi:PKD repeat protein